MKPNTLADWLASLTLVALTTTLVLPGRQTAQVTTAAANGGAKLFSSVIAK